MIQNARDILIGWLKDAHAMETALEKTLERQRDHAKGSASMRARIDQHVAETRVQAKRLESCLARYGTDGSLLKDSISKVQGLVQGLVAAATSDGLVKDVLMDIGAEHFEIACYRSLETAAENLGDWETAKVARQSRSEEEDFVTFLEQQLPEATRLAMQNPAA
jgi:ferritin-like metal-binding protein YciE